MGEFFRWWKIRVALTKQQTQSQKILASICSMGYMMEVACLTNNVILCRRGRIYRSIWIDFFLKLKKPTLMWKYKGGRIKSLYVGGLERLLVWITWHLVDWYQRLVVHNKASVCMHVNMVVLYPMFLFKNYCLLQLNLGKL